MVKELPIVANVDEEVFCFFDERLKELRDIYNPHNRFPLNEFEMEYYKGLVKEGKTLNDVIYQRETKCKNYNKDCANNTDENNDGYCFECKPANCGYCGGGKCICEYDENGMLKGE